MWRTFTPLNAQFCHVLYSVMFCAYVLPYHSISLHTHCGKSGKCRLEPTQTATTSSILCRQHGPIWPKLEQHGVSSPTCRDMLAPFPAKTSSFFGIGILLVSDLLGFQYFRSVLLYCKFWREHLFKNLRELFF
jgi:hypothetical protein